MRRTTFSFNKISYMIFGFYSIGYLTKITRRKEDAQLFLFEGILILSYLVLSLEAETSCRLRIARRWSKYDSAPRECAEDRFHKYQETREK